MNSRMLNILKDADAVIYDEAGGQTMALVGEEALINLFDLIVKDILSLLEGSHHTVVDRVAIADLIRKRYQ